MPIAIFGSRRRLTIYDDTAGYTIPNVGSTPYGWLQRPSTETDERIRTVASRGEGVLLGCQVTAPDDSAFYLNIAAGSIQIGGVSASVATCIAIPNTPDVTNPRIDVVAAHILSSGAGHVQLFAGTASSNPLPPAIDNGYVALAFVGILPATPYISSLQIVDKRALVVAPTVPTIRTVLAGNAQSTTIAAGTVNYLGFTGVVAATRVPVEVIMPYAGTLRNLYARTGSAQPAGDDLTLTLLKNGLSAAISIVITAGSAAGTYSDLTNTVTVAAGDLIAIVASNDDPSNPSASLRGVSIELDAA
jgi:hypothetical protein